MKFFWFILIIIIDSAFLYFLIANNFYTLSGNHEVLNVKYDIAKVLKSAFILILIINFVYFLYVCP